MGLGRSVIQLHGLELYLTTHWTEERILALYLATGVSLGAVLLWGAARPRVRRRLVETWRTEILWPTCAGLVLAWCVFAFCWEPVGYYWSGVLIPLLLLAAWVHESVSPPAKRASVVVLMSLSIWNLWANHRADQAAAARAPEP